MVLGPFSEPEENLCMKSLEDIFGVPNPQFKCFYRDMMDEVLVLACGQHIYSSSKVDQHIHIHTYHIHIIYISYTYHIHIIYISYTYHIHIIYISYTYHIHIIYISYTYHIHIIYISYTYHIHIIYIFFRFSLKIPILWSKKKYFLFIPFLWSLNFTAVQFLQARGMLFQKCSLAMRAFDWTPRSELYLEPWPVKPWLQPT